MKVVEFVLLLYMSGGELIEYTVRDGLSECLSTKRTMERNMTIDPNNATGTRISCQKCFFALQIHTLKERTTAAVSLMKVCCTFTVI